MSRMASVWILLAGLLASCSREPEVSTVERTSASARPPDIVLVSIDSLRADHLGCYGYAKPTSPVIDALAREGVRCETAISTTSWTLPAHAAMFTGLYDSAHGVTSPHLRLPEDRRTLAELLHDAGYRTGGFFGGPFLHSLFGLDQGFEEWHDCMGAPATENEQGDVHAWLQASHADVTGPRTLAAVETWLARDDPRPIFLFVHLWDVHFDYLPPPEYARMFDPTWSGPFDATNLDENPAISAAMPARAKEHLIALYDGEIRWTDDHLGKILAALERRGALADTLVVVTADHGEEFFEHGGKGHHKTLYDEVVRVPLVVRWPGRFPAGRVIREQVRLVDLMPTLLEIAGVAERPPMQGRDLGPALRGGLLTPAPALCELLSPRYDLRALRTETSKVLSWKRGTLAAGFDLQRDPGEVRPLPGTEPWASAALEELRALTDASLAANKGHEAQKALMDAQTYARLRALGYVGGEDSGR